MRNIISIFLIFNLSFYSNAQIDSIKYFRREIPTGYNNKPDLFYSLDQQKARQLNLENLINGYDSIQIRIWYDYALSNFHKLVVIKRHNLNWTAEVYLLNVTWDYNTLTDSILGKQVKKIIPKNGWDSFILNLFNLKITTLPNMRDIPGLKDNWTDGAMFNVEIATKNNYRYYSYHLPDKFNKFWQANNMFDILKLLEIEFDVHYDKL